MIEPFLCLLSQRLTELVLREPELQLVLSAYADDVLLVAQDPGELVRVKACQAIYLAASSAQDTWVKSSGLVIGMGGRRAPSHPHFRPSGGARVRCSILAFTFLPHVHLRQRTGTGGGIAQWWGEG
ncbi:unnamed protein product [Natator depressus]